MHCFYTGKVRTFILCCECGKRRVVYSPKKLTVTDMLAIHRLQEELIYTCGDTLFPEGSEYREVVIVREGITCKSAMETTYYAGGKISFR